MISAAAVGEKEPDSVYRGAVLLCAEVSEQGRGYSFLEGISPWFILGDSELGVLLLKNTLSFEAHNSAFKTSQ